MNEGKSSIYKGKGFILKTANKEYINNSICNRSKNKSSRNNKKYIFVERKKSTFSRYNPVVMPILFNKNNKKKNEYMKKNDINILNEGEINSFLLRNKAFRLTWSCIIKKIKKEIDMQISKNLSNIFEEIFLYSISNNEQLPLILMTAGTNVADHEIIIDTLSYEFKRWNYKKGRISEDSDILKLLCKSEKKGRSDNNYRSGNNDSCFDDRHCKDEPYEDNDIYVCSLNSSTSNNINSSIYNIYNQLYKEYKMRSFLAKYRKKKGNNDNDNYGYGYDNSYDVGMHTRRTSSRDSFSCIKNERDSGISNFSFFLNKEMDQECKINKRMVSIDKLVELYKLMSEVNMRKGGGSSHKGQSGVHTPSLDATDDKYNESNNDNNIGNNSGKVGGVKSNSSSNNSNSSDGSYCSYDDNSDNLRINYRKLELYNKQNEYFADGRKKVRVVVLIHDCEYFNINILNGILNVLINLRIDSKMCLSVILGVSTPSFFFNRITTPDTQSKLRIKTVDILNNKLICEYICNSILFENFLPFMINFRTMHAIKLLLHKNNQSVSHLVYILYILTKEFYDNNLLSFLSLPIYYYLNDEQGNDNLEFQTEYSPYTFVRSNQKSFSNYLKYDIRTLHKKIICLCYSSNLYYRHLSYLKKVYSNVLVHNYFLLHGKDSIVHTPTNSDNELINFTLKRNRSNKKKKKKKKSKDDDNASCHSLSSDPERGSFTNTDKLSTDVNMVSVHWDEKRETTKKRKNSVHLHSSGGMAHQLSGKTLLTQQGEGSGKNLQNGIKNEYEEKNAVNDQHDTNAQYGRSTFNINGVTKQNETTDEQGSSTQNYSIFNRNLHAWQFKANTINWWFDHPFKDLIYSYENKKIKDNFINNIDKLLESTEEKCVKNLYDINNIKDINKCLCESSLPTCVLQLIERKYAFNIAINFINIVIKCKSEYANSLKRAEYFRKLFENFEKVKWQENTSILYIEELYKIVERDVKKCISFLIDIITPYYYKNQEILLDMLKEFKKYYTTVYAIVYNLEDYLYLLKEKECQKDKETYMNDDFAKSCTVYSVSYSIYYSLLTKLDDLIQMLRQYINEKKGAPGGSTTTTAANGNLKRLVNCNVSNETHPEQGLVAEMRTELEAGSEAQMQSGNTKDDNEFNTNGEAYQFGRNTKYRKKNEGRTGMTMKKKAYKRYLTIQNSSLKNRQNGEHMKQINVEDILELLNQFVHDYLYLLLLPPIYHHPLAYELIIHRPDRDFTDIMTRDIKYELLQTLCYTKPYKTGSLMCSCCFFPENLENSDPNTNIVCDNKIYLNPYYDNISSLEDLVNIYRIYEKCNKTMDLYNLFILFLNIKIDTLGKYSMETTKELQSKSLQKEGDDYLYGEVLQEYYLKFIVAVSTFCSFFKILKPPNVSALLNYNEKGEEIFDDDDIDDNTTKGREGANAEESVTKFLADIKKSLQGCTSKKLLFGKLYYNQTIVSRELYLQRMIDYNSEYKNQVHFENDNIKRQKN
ncbi:conserved Plasmodium protein, unknown function [Plasmodium malariae]|uniref:Origin recognition complex subunit 3 N-terminal domain-containing protein n=1 Tax=Plasmodium malariae TaxID=5858 RepID=A0A1C3KE16_PLAMA|nr:conserved Plasmodium protein, unknown function [Plasmodium malariae]